MTTVHGGRGLAQRVLDGFEQLRVDPTLFAPTATTWHNFDEADLDLTDSLQALQRIRAVVPDFRFADREYHDTADGTTVVQYQLAGTLPDGSPFRCPACAVLRSVDGRVSRVEEYLDTARLKPLMRALENAVPRRVEVGQ